MATETIEKPKVSKKNRTKTKPIHPKMYSVIFHNDDKTPVDFVIDVLIGIFKMNIHKAEKITWEIHNASKGVAGIYPYEIAETKKSQAEALALKNNYPLTITLEKE